MDVRNQGRSVGNRRTSADPAERHMGAMSVGLVAQLASPRSDLRSFRVSRRCPRSLQSAQSAPGVINAKLARTGGSSPLAMSRSLRAARQATRGDRAAAHVGASG